MNMETKIEFKDEAIVDALVGALEGGSNYWYFLPDLSMVKKYEDKCKSENIILSALNGAVIPVNDLDIDEAENDEIDPEDNPAFLGYLSKENIERGLKLFIEDGRDFDPEEMDADDSDVLFQFIVMGEIVFG